MMQIRLTKDVLGVAAAVSMALATSAAWADSAADFYRGKEVSMYVAGSASGPMNSVFRVLSPYLEKHIPGNPKMIAQAMPGAGGLKAANFVYNAAPKDGTAMGYFLRGVAFNQAFDAKNVRYDVRKFNWIGSIEPVSSFVALWHTAPAKSLAEAKKIEVPLGSTGLTSQTFQTPMLLNAFIGTKFKPIPGYGGLGKVYLAIENGEVYGAQMSLSGLLNTKPHWLTDKLVIPLAQTGMKKMKGYESVPRLYDLAENDLQRDVFEFYSLPDTLGRVIAAPPGVPADRVKALRDGFMAAMKDPDYLRDQEKAKLGVDPMDHEETVQVVMKTISVKPEVVAKLKEILGENIGGE